MSFTVRQLKAFAAVADTGSFRAAAELMYLSPAAVSLLIRELENSLGFAVFERHSRRVAISRPGREFLPAAQRLLRELHATELAAREVQTRSSGTVRVAAPLIIASLMLPQAIAAFQALQPEITVRPVDCSLDELVHMAEDERVDFSIGADRPTGAGVAKTDLLEAPWMLWCAPAHPLAALPRVEWGDLRAHAVITPGSEFQARIAATLQHKADLSPFKAAYEVSNITTALGMAAAGLGITVAPAFVAVIAQHLGLVGKALHAPATGRKLVIFQSSLRALSPPAEQFQRFAIAHFRSQRA